MSGGGLPEPDLGAIVARTREMVAIDSVNPDLEPGAAGEAAMARYVAAELARIGVRPELQEVDGDRVNVVGIVPGAGGGRSLMLNGHLDTVGVTGMRDPFGAELADGRIRGRGAWDMKGSLAAMLEVVRVLAEGRPRLAGDVVFTAVVDEEYGSLGTERLVEAYRTDGAVLTEPTDLRVCRAHRGFVWLEVLTHGRAAHGSRWREGIDANVRMGRVLVEIGRLADRLVRRAPHPLLGPPSLHVPLLAGGTSQSVYAATCRAELERRVLPGETVAEVVAEVQAVLDRIAAADPGFGAEVRAFFDRSPYEIAADAEIVEVARGAVHAVTGADPEVYGETWWMDSALLADAGIETVIVGPSGGGIHTEEEWVEVASLETLARVLVRIATAWCGTA